MRLRRIILMLAFLLILNLGLVEATPSTTYWTVCTTDIQADGVWHIGVDNYFTVFNRRGHGSSFPPDVGLTYGLFNRHHLALEWGSIIWAVLMILFILMRKLEWLKINYFQKLLPGMWGSTILGHAQGVK